jgi:diguanylate cyclase (GGDEF)-like protein
MLVQIGPSGVEARWELGSRPITIGRTEDNDVVISDARISRHHARIEPANGRYKIVDLDSTHRTYVNSTMVDTHVLVHADHINFGKKANLYYLDEDDPSVIERAIAAHREPEEIGQEGGFTGVVGKQVEGLMEALKGKNLDTVVLRRINDEVSRSISELKCLYEVGNAISSELDLDKVLDLILYHVIRVIGAERGFIMLRDEQDKLVPMAARNMESTLDSVERLQFSRTIANRAIETGLAVVTKDTSLDPAISSQSVVDYNIRSAICAPLSARGQHIGALYVDAKQSMKEFSQKDGEFFGALANQSAIAIENARLLRRLKSTIGALDRKVKELGALYTISQSIVSGREQDEVLRTILRTAVETIGAQRGSIMLYADETDVLTVRVVEGDLNPTMQDRISLRKGEGIAGKVAETGQAKIANLGRQDPEFSAKNPRESDVRQLMCIPLQGKRDIIGVINLVNKRSGEPFSQEDLDLLSSIAPQAAVTIENFRLYNYAVSDGLTGLYVRRHFDGWLLQEFERVKRYGGELSVIMVDIDHFKHINDTYGHPIGDWVLIEVAKILKSRIREPDIVARYGGEEFVVVLPATEIAGAEVLAERLRRAIEEKSFENKALCYFQIVKRSSNILVV